MADWDIRKLQILRTLRERGTVTATAEALNMTPSAVSQQLANLARQLGVELLRAQGRRVRLTDAALLVLRHTEAVFEQLERADAELAAYVRGEAGEVRVGAFSTAVPALVVPAVTALRATHPAVAVRVREAEAQEAYELLGAGEVDLALSLAAQAPSAADPRFTRVPLLADPWTSRCPTATRWPAPRTCASPTSPPSRGSSARAAPGPTSRAVPARRPASARTGGTRRPAGRRSSRWSRRAWAWPWCPAWPPCRATA